MKKDKKKKAHVIDKEMDILNVMKLESEADMRFRGKPFAKEAIVRPLTFGELLQPE